MSDPALDNSLLLDVDSVTIGYSGAPVVNGVSLTVGAGEVVCLLGPNGAGKTTTLSAVSGLLSPRSGSIRFDGQAITGLSADRIARRGLVQVPEDRALFGSLTVRENLAAASRDAQRQERVLEYFPALAALVNRRASVLSGGEQQMLVLARAMVLQPRLLIVDEMSLGLAPLVVARILAVLRELAEATGCGLLLVEQHVHLALEIADRAYVMVRGSVISEGTAAEVSGNLDEIRGSYLGSTAPTA
jgi:branched-chain amino acid transport system ATP-binding protein